MNWLQIRDTNTSFVVSAIALVALAGFLAGCPGEETEEDEAEFSVAIDEDASTLEVEEGSEVTIEAEIENVGDDLGTQDVEFSIDDSVESTEEDVELEVGQSETVSFSWQTEEGDAGTYSAAVASDDDEDTSEVTVQEPGEADVEFTVQLNEEESTLEVTEGETAEIGIGVENVGEDTGSQTIELSLDGSAVGESDIELEGGQSGLVLFEWETSEGQAGTYSAEASSEDDSVSFDVVIDEATTDPEQGTLSGTLTDADTGEVLENVLVELRDTSDDSVVDTVTTDSNGEYEFADIEQTDYELRLSSAGLHPDHTIEESDDQNVVGVTVDAENVTQDLTLSWMDETNLYVDGGTVEFEFVAATDDSLAIELPGCEESDGDWAPIATSGEPDDDVTSSFDPDDVCFALENVGVNLADGTLDVEGADVVFPNIGLVVDDSEDNDINAGVDQIDVTLESMIDGVSGNVDFPAGSLDVDMDVRFGLDGTVTDAMTNEHDFGTGAGNPDCQLTGGWGQGDLNSPGDAQDGGEYVHDPIELQLTTGTSGPGDAEGTPFDESTGVFVTVDNQAVIGRLSEGAEGADDSGGAACGEFSANDSTFDVAGQINDLMNLPAEEGDAYFEFDFLVP